jgi:NADPH:quinone reductase-like Zn-dependent oxidoreductase
MKDWNIQQYGDPDEVKLADLPTPRPGVSEVLIRVESASVNPLDNKLVSGALKSAFPLKFPYVLGTDAAGVIEAVGHDVTLWKAGDRVFAKCDGGAFAEHLVLPEASLARIPDGVSFADAAALPTAAGTAWEALMENAELREGQTVLVHAGSGGVGHFAVQFAKLAGARVIATTSAANLKLVRDLGADEVIDHKADDFAKKVRGVDVVLDPLGGETQKKSFGVLREGGILISLVQPPDRALAEQHKVRAEMMMHKPLAGRLEHIAGLIADGRLRVVTEATFAFAKVPDALARVATGKAKGKVLVDVT